MFLDINEFVEEPKYFPVVVIQPNAQDFIVGMDCGGTSVFKCVTREVRRMESSSKILYRACM